MKPSANDTCPVVPTLHSWGHLRLAGKLLTGLLTSQQLSHAHDTVKVRSQAHGNLSAV